VEDCLKAAAATCQKCCFWNGSEYKTVHVGVNKDLLSMTGR